MSFRAVAWLVIVAGAVPVAAQDVAPDTSQTCTALVTGGLPGVLARREDYLRAVNLRGEQSADVLIRRPSHGPRIVEVPCDEPWHLAAPGTEVVPAMPAVAASFDAIYNTGYPHGTQTGLLWPGRGLHALWTAGADYRAGPLHVGVYPQLAYHQNRAFPFVQFPGDSGSTFAYTWARSASGHPLIDWPQRHGDESFWRASLGQSFISVEVVGLRAGVSTENLWWGPAMRNSIMLGNEAPGFPHVFVATPRGIATPIGRVSAELLAARLAESDYFNTDDEDDHRFLSALALSFQPRGVTGLSVGAARLYYQPYENLGVSDLLPFLETPFKNALATPENPSGDDVADQLFGLYARYAIPRTGFEVYAEWARNDHSQHIDDLYAEPDHSRAYTLGFQQVWSGASRWYRIRGELTQLGLSKSVALRPTPRYYVHTLVRQGYTHRGELLGAAVGPGSEAQFLAFDTFLGRGSHGIFLERVRYDEDAMYTYVAPRYTYQGHDVELTAGTNHLFRVGPLELAIGLSYSNRRNRGFRHCNPETPAPRDCRMAPFRDSNWHLPVGIVWRRTAIR